MITVWFFLAIFYSSYGSGVTQAGPFVSLQQCESAIKAWASSSGLGTFNATKASTCYQGVIK